MNYRIIAGITTALLTANIMSVLPRNAFAVGYDGSRVYEKDGYTVTYKISDEWDNNRSVDVFIQNTGNESILNWALKYDAGGEVYNLWNSAVYDSGEDYVILKNNGYNYEIEAGQSASFGYIVTGEESFIPEDIELCSRRIEVKSGYDVQLNVTSEWNTGFNADVSITNTSDEPIEAWTLSFEGNFDITNIWNAKLLSSENRSYETANQLWTTPIKAGETATFGISADKSATENISADNFVLTAVVIGESSLEKEPEISEPDDPWGDIDFELDTDNDGLPDYYEDIIETDKNEADTDGDGLSDSYEVMYLGTDPTKPDSDDNGINDGDEDPDKDGLTNAEECKLGTFPVSADTDGDGLTDGAEVNQHGTDPLKFDTDEDGISDGDEITLGLDPKNSSTDGTPDCERTFIQVIDAGSEVFSVINKNKDNPFKVSLEIKAAGAAEKNLSAYESGYSAAMKNPATIGIIPQFDYTDDFKVEEVTVKFELDDSITNNTLGTFSKDSDEFSGIKRLNIFKYFEDINMLLPVETFHDTKNNIVYTKTDCLGTYCLMDMELWLDSLGISAETSAPEKTEAEESEAMSENSVDNDNYLCYNVKERNAKSSDRDIYKDDLNIVFIIDTRVSESELEIQKKNILDISRTVLKRSPNSRIYILEQNTNASGKCKVYSASGNRFFTNYSVLEDALGDLRHNNNIANMSILSDGISEVVSICDLNRETYVFSIFNQSRVIYRVKDGYNSLDKVVNADVNISVIAKIDSSMKYGYARDMYISSGGKLFDDYEDYADDVINYIYGRQIDKIEEDTGEYSMILATGLVTAQLDAPITEEYAVLA